MHNLPALLVPAGVAATAGAVMLTTRNGTLACATLLTGLAGSIAGSLLSMTNDGAEEPRAGVRELASSTSSTDIPVAPRDETDHLPGGPFGDTLAPPPTAPPTPDFLPPSSGDVPGIDLPEIDVPEFEQPHVPFPDEYPAPPTAPPTPDTLPPQSNSSSDFYPGRPTPFDPRVILPPPRMPRD